MNKYKLVLKLYTSTTEIAKSIYKAILPDIYDTPSECTINARIENEYLFLEISCKRINLLRALYNSYFSVISMILHTLEVLYDESTKTSTRSTTDIDTISSFKRKLR
ncbi:MAG: hypothetical protein J7L82_00150 [Staphylothermus sp.]|nr:hypothetical protein [Staphylothermus sp.]